jgi:ribosomal protein S18 acetylase RimI-like enzyme
MKPFRIERLSIQDRQNFDCGNHILNRYLQRMAGQDQRKNYAVCFLTIENETERIAGYYSLSAGSVELDRLSETQVQSLPKYPAVPVARIGRLAVDKSFQGQGIARWMLVDAALRVSSMEIGAFALAVDAKDDEAEAFYLHYGFQKIESRKVGERILILPLNGIPNSRESA